jgi:hypothetical protein
MNRRQLHFLFQEPGMLEAIASDPEEELGSNHVLSQGYADTSVPDLMVDCRLDEERPFAWISYNFDKTYPAVIWGLHFSMSDERFDIPQAGLTNVLLDEAFSWAYAHFVLEDEITPFTNTADSSLTRRVLQHALSDV